MKDILSKALTLIGLCLAFFYLGKKDEKFKNEKKKSEKNEKALKLALKPRPSRSGIIKWLSGK